jgi:hypothetical protein
MRIGASLALFAFGAILALAVHVDDSVININLIGLILMLVAVVGFAFSPAALSIQRRTTVTKAADDGGPAEVQETVEQENTQTVDHPKWVSRTATTTPDTGTEPVAQRAGRSWPNAG